MNLGNGVCGPDGCTAFSPTFECVNPLDTNSCNNNVCVYPFDPTTCIITVTGDHGWLAFRIVIGSCMLVAVSFYFILSTYVSRITR